MAVIVGAVVALLVLARPPVRDETHTLAQARAPHLDRWIETTRTADDRSPALANLTAWAAGRVGLGDLRSLRTVFSVGWVVGAVALAAVVRRCGGGVAAMISAGVLPAASGLASVGALARPYGLALGATAVAVERYSTTFEHPTRGRIAAMAGALGVAIALHYAVVTVLPCLLVAEVVARRRDPARGRGVHAGLALSASPLLVLAISIVRSIGMARAQPRVVGPWSVPSFYVSVLLPCAVFLGALAVAVLVLRPPQLAALMRSPVGIASVLLAVTVPAQVFVVVSVSSGAFFHRYALAGVVGIALCAGGAVASIEADRHRVAVLLACLAVASIVPATVRALGEGPTRGDVRRTIDELALGPAPGGRVLVVDPFVLSLIRSEAGAELAERLALAGPSNVVGDRPEPDLLAAPPVPADERGAAVVVADPRTLVRLEREHRLRDVEELGRSRLRTNGWTDELVAVRAVVGP